MKPKTLLITVCMLLLLTEFASAQIRRRPGRLPRRQHMQHAAQPPIMLGVYGGQNLDTEHYLAGGHLWLPAGIFWNFVPGFTYHFTDDNYAATRWQVNGDLVFKPRPRGPLYFGGGVVMDYLSPDGGESDGQFGGSVLAGLMFGARRSPMQVFVQGRYNFLDDTEFNVTAGLNLALR